MILFVPFNIQVKLFYRLRKLQKRLLIVLGLTELLIFCSNFVLGPFVLLWFLLGSKSLGQLANREHKLV